MAVGLPQADVDALTVAARAGPAAVARLSARSGSAVLRRACTFVTEEVDRHGGDYVAGLLVGAAMAARSVRTEQQVDIVWTGPGSEVDTSRLTSRVVIDLIGEAERSVLLVSYATFAEPRLVAALENALGRGVDVTVLLERAADNPAYRSEGDPFPGLRLRRITWPAEHRQAGASLHAKLIVVDEHTALVGSANLTGRALDDNIECGVVIRGGLQPRRLVDHVWSLVRSGTLAAERIR